MISQTSRRLLLAAVAWAVAGMIGWCQAPGIPPASVTESPAAPVISDPVIPPLSGPPPAITSPPQVTLEDHHGPLLMGSLPFNPTKTSSAWSAGLDIALVKPHLKNSLVAPVTFHDPTTHRVMNQVVTTDHVSTARVHVQEAGLDWTASPSLELGYRLPQGSGAILGVYRSVASQGNSELSGPNGAHGQLRSRLDLSVFDLDYASGEYNLEQWGEMDMRWKAGVRFASVFFDSRALTDPLSPPFGNTLEARTSNFFLGAGPHAGLEMIAKTETPGLSLYVGLAGALVVGRISQSFEQLEVPPSADPSQRDRVIGAAAIQRDTHTVPVLNLEAGIRWTPGDPQRLRFSLGYQYEYWWYVGQVGDSRAELRDQGVFCRCECNF